MTDQAERPEDTLRRYAALLGALCDLHAPLEIYGDLDHYHDPAEADWPEGHTRVDTGYSVTCEAMAAYVICEHCCTDGNGGQTGECATAHDHGPGNPRCPTAAILDGGGDGRP